MGIPWDFRGSNFHKPKFDPSAFGDSHRQRLATAMIQLIQQAFVCNAGATATHARDRHDMSMSCCEKNDGV
jgi:hypothetical protein